MLLYVLALTLIMVLILCGIYLILSKYHRLLNEVIQTQTSLLRTLTNLSASKDIQGFAALQNLTELKTSSVPEISRIDPGTLSQETVDAVLGRFTPEQEISFEDEFGGLG